MSWFDSLHATSLWAARGESLRFAAVGSRLLVGAQDAEHLEHLSRYNHWLNASKDERVVWLTGHYAYLGKDDLRVAAAAGARQVIAKYQRNITGSIFDRLGLDEFATEFWMWKAHDLQRDYVMSPSDYAKRIQPAKLVAEARIRYPDKIVQRWLDRKCSKYSLTEIAEQARAPWPEGEEGAPRGPGEESRETYRRLKRQSDAKIETLLANCEPGTFTLSGSDIDQTGVDADPTGLQPIAGVNSIETGSGAGAVGVYEFSERLHVSGTLTVDPEQYLIVINRATNADSIQVNGTLNLGTTISVNSVDRQPVGTVIHDADNANWNNGDVIQVQNGGTLNWRGGTIFSAGKSLRYLSGSTVQLDGPDCIFLRKRDPVNAQGQIRQDNSNYDQSGFTDISHNDDNDWFSFIGFWSTMNGYRPVHKKSALAPSTASSTSLYRLENYVSGGGNTDDVVFWQNKYARFVDSSDGSNLVVTGLSANSSLNRGCFEMAATVRFRTVDSIGNPLEGARFFIRDYNNGDRKNFTNPNPDINFVNDRTYSDVSAASGLVPEVEILIASVVRNSGSPKGTNDVGDNKKDYRCKSNGTVDDFDVGWGMYGYRRRIQENLILKGVNGVDSTVVFDADPGTTETSLATVQSWTELTNGSEFYDRASAWSLEDSSGLNLEYPSLALGLVTSQGSTIVLNTVSLVIDSAASSALSVNTSTDVVTIDPGSGSFGLGSFSAIGGNVTVVSDTSIDGWTIDGDLTIESLASLTGVTVTGDLRVNIPGSLLALDGCEVQGNVFNDSGSALEVQLVNGSVASTTEPGTGSGQVEITNPLAMTITGHPAGATIVVYDDDSADPQELGTELARFNSASTSEAYTYDASFLPNSVVVTMVESTYKRYVSSPVSLLAVDFTFTIEPELETN